MDYRTAARPAEEKITVSRSIFIARIKETIDEPGTRAFLSEIKALNPRADHHCYAFRLGTGESAVSHCNDAGEPSGSAGRHILGAIIGADLTNVMIVVSRYFGGKKLGLAGLAAAYRDAATAVIKAAGAAVKTPTFRVEITLPYTKIEQVRYLAGLHGVVELQAEYEAEIRLKLEVPLSAAAEFRAELATLGLRTKP